MCTHEIWRYAECGCRYDHHISCFDALVAVNNDLPEPRSTRNSNKSGVSRAPTDSSPVKLPPSPSPTDSEDEVQLQKWRPSPRRSCSVNRTVHKTFLEPICHDCLLAELVLGRDNPKNNNTGGVNLAEDNMIWDSEVKIEVGDSVVPTSEPTQCRGQASNGGKILESTVEVRISDISQPKSLILPNISQYPDRASEPSTLSTGDADSESSAPSITTRGRPRSRSKQVRRMAMDVSREDIRLRISSRLPTFQREDLQSFKDELRLGRPRTSHTAHDSHQTSPPKRSTPKPLKSFMQRLTDANGEKWLKAKDAVNDLGRKMSRKSPSPKRMLRMRNPVHYGYQERSRDGSLNKLKKEIVDYNRAVDASTNSTPERPSTGSSIAPESFYLQPNDPFHPTIGRPNDYTPLLHTLPQTPTETWRFHLEHDLTTPRQRRYRPALCSPLNDGPTAILDGKAKPLLDMPDRIHPSGSTSTTAVSTSKTSQNWQSHPSTSSNPFSHKSYEYITDNDEAEDRRRLLSRSTALSGPATSMSESYSIDSVQQHRLASLVSDGDFDQPDDQVFSVGIQNIEREMAMVGLTENPWRGHSLSPASETSELHDNNTSKRFDACTSGEVSGSSEDPFRDNASATPPLSRLPEAASLPTAIRSSTSTSTKAIPHDLSTLSGLPNIAYLSPYTPQLSDLAVRNSPAFYSPSPTPSPATPFNKTNINHRQLALHALSTPFHHSLAPNQHHYPDASPNHGIGPVHLLTTHYQRPAPQTDAIAPRLQARPSFNTKATRPRSAPAPISVPSSSAYDRSHPHALVPEAEAAREQKRGEIKRQAHTGVFKTIAHVDPQTTPPEAPSDFSLGVKSPVGLFSCVWVRNMCPGLAEAEVEDSVDGESDVREARETEIKASGVEVDGSAAADGDGEKDDGGSEVGLLGAIRPVIGEGINNESDIDVRDSQDRGARQIEAGEKPKSTTDTAPQHRCGRLTTWQVRSCICSGRVRTASSLTATASTAIFTNTAVAAAVDPPIATPSTASQQQQQQRKQKQDVDTPRSSRDGARAHNAQTPSSFSSKRETDSFCDGTRALNLTLAKNPDLNPSQMPASSTTSPASFPAPALTLTPSKSTTAAPSPLTVTIASPPPSPSTNLPTPHDAPAELETENGCEIERGSGTGLEGQCRSIAPVVRYAVGEWLCGFCEERERRGALY